jgi:hypothetical protein
MSNSTLVLTMPIHRGSDSKGPFYQWGKQKKYYYKPGDKKSRDSAYNKAWKQSVAIRVSSAK